MTVYVVVPIKDGLFGEVTVFLSRAGARTAEHRWLRRANIHDNKERERLASGGTSIAILECPIKP